MATWPTLARLSPRRAKFAGFRWLILFSCIQGTRWLYRLILLLVQKSLMRLGIGDVANVENKAIHDTTSLSNTRVSYQHPNTAFPRGLSNTGNLCFVNTVLQCLATIPGFRDSVDQSLQVRKQHETNDEERQKLLVAEIVVNLLKGISFDQKLERIANEEEQDREPYDGQQMMRKFRAAASRCTYLVSSAASRQEQQDAEEFLSFLLELLHEVLRTPPEKDEEDEAESYLQLEQALLKQLKRYDPNDPRSYLPAVANLGQVRWDHFLRQNVSVITNYFSGQSVRGSQCCSCAKLTCLHEEQRIISLAIAADKSEQTLVDCLEHFRHPEQLTGDNRVYCDGFCRTKTNRLTQILLQRVPPVLIFRLQRFKHMSSRGRAEKVDTAVTFPCGSKDRLNIAMNAFFRDEVDQMDFKLTAVCAHLGSSIDSGHYVAYVRHQRIERDEKLLDQWFRIDDEVVTVIDETQLRTETLSSAYLLFYVHVKNGEKTVMK